MYNPAISVVIPVYNQEKYVGRCIRSVLNQTFQCFEVILVNDGSMDMSLTICKKYAKKDKRISIIEKRNEGQSQARKDGFLKAKGEYVAFIDSDDYFDHNALETLYEIAQKTGVDMVAGNTDRVWDNWGIVKKSAAPYKEGHINRVIKDTELLTMMLGLDGKNSNFWGIAVNFKLFRRDCIKKAFESQGHLLFSAQKNFPEDDLFNLAITPFLRSMWISNIVIYHYRYGGCTTRDFPVIRKGVCIYDDRYDACFKFRCESALPDVFERYVTLLYWDVLQQIHFQISTDQSICDFIHKEISERKIVLWAQQHTSELPLEMRKDVLIQSVLNSDVKAFFRKVMEIERFLRPHYRKMKIARHYQIIVDFIGRLHDCNLSLLKK